MLSGGRWPSGPSHAMTKGKRYGAQKEWREKQIPTAGESAQTHRKSDKMPARAASPLSAPSSLS